MSSIATAACAMRKIVITGGAGSLGRELALRLARTGHRVRVFDLPWCDFSPFGGVADVEIMKGDIGDINQVRCAVVDVDGVVHLAALLPPASERDRDATMRVNVGGTEKVVQALERENPDASFILSSSACVYGDTTAEQPPVRVSHHQCALDFYAESKIEAERALLDSTLPYGILRISGVSVPALLEPPAVWPFMENQRIEFVCRRDVVAALAACLLYPKAKGKVFNVAGGPTWQMLGGAYVARLSKLMGISAEEARYSDRPGSFDWYDTSESQAALRYQRTSFDRFLELLERAIAKWLGGEETERREQAGR